MIALTDCEIYTGDGVLRDHAVVIRGEKIAAVVAADGIPAGIDTIGLGGAGVAPGFVDLQVNGGGGVLFSDTPTPDAIEKIVAAHRPYGTTDLLATFITGTDAATASAISAVRACLDEGTPGVLGIHLEGPFLNPARAGVHDASLMRRMSVQDAVSLPTFEHGIVLATVAPEMADAGAIHAAVQRGIKISAGHTDADHEQMQRAFAEGLDCATHLFNAMRGIESREPGVVGSILASDSAWSGIIVDGFHVHFAAVRAAWKGMRGRMYLVTDAMPPVGSEMESFRIGNHVVWVAGGRCQTSEGRLAGSAADMASAVRNAVEWAGVPKDEALRMASTYPARYVGVGDRLGKIAPGFEANMVVVDDDLHVLRVMVRGELVEG